MLRLVVAVGGSRGAIRSKTNKNYNELIDFVDKKEDTLLMLLLI